MVPTTLLDTPAAGVDPGPTPIDEYLRRRLDLTAVERFAGRDLHADPAPRARWRDRLPATPPGPGQQYAFEVDLDACTGCKACVAACHSLNGLDDGEEWRRVGTLHGEDAAGRSVTTTVTHACHHCVEPACLAGCPAEAYEKDPVTGIVRHLDDSCIGCSYCTLTCPYEVPAYNASLGIVRKCDLCADRLSEGEAPACVQGCPQGAITIGLVELAPALGAVPPAPAGAAERGATPDPEVLVPGAPPSSITEPTTTYRSATPLPADLVAADRRTVQPAAGHAPLAVMLALTQASVGLLCGAAILRFGAVEGLDRSGPGALTTAGLVTGIVALAVSVLHLGRPHLAWRAVLGLRHSWLSREVVAFGGFAGAATVDAAARHLDVVPPVVGDGAARAAVVLGLGGVACSAQLYAVTHRSWWRWRFSGPRFAATVVATGALGTAAVLWLSGAEPGPGLLRALVGTALVATSVAVVTALVPLLGRFRRGSAELDDTAALLRGPLAERFQARLVLAAVGGLAVPGLVLAVADDVAASTTGVLLAVAWASLLAGEHQDRRLFFLASAPPRMPGQPR